MEVTFIICLISVLVSYEAAHIRRTRPKRLQALPATNGNRNGIDAAKNTIDSAKKKVEDVGSSIEETIGKIKSAPTDISLSVDRKVSEVKNSVNTVRKFAIDTYNAPGYYLRLAQNGT